MVRRTLGRSAGVSSTLMCVLAVCAQAQPGDALQSCAAVADQAARLSCYDRAVGRDAPDAADAADQAGTRAVVRGADTDADTGQGADDVAAVESERRSEDAEPRRARDRRERTRDRVAFTITVVQRVENLSGLSVFVSEDGRVFDQMSPRRSRFPEPPFSATMNPASRGSFWLTSETGAGAVRVTQRD